MSNVAYTRIAIAGLVLGGLGLWSAGVLSDTTFTVGVPGQLAQTPLYLKANTPPLNMLVMGKDHKIYYEAYNDASDLNGDGALDIGYRGWELRLNPTPDQSKYKIDYYGYFNSYACYSWQTDKFIPVSATSTKQCSGNWSGDFLNYLTTSRMDALRRVLYGGWRQVDTASETVLQGAFFPQDAHSWGKEYKDVARDGYDISNYAPLSRPVAGKYHLFAVTTLSDNSAPVFRVLRNSDFRVWNWLSIEGPVANNKCFNSSSTRVDCVSGGGGTWSLVPASSFNSLSLSTWKSTGGSPGDRATMDARFAATTTTTNLCGTGPVASINKPASNNPFLANGCTNDNYISRITGNLVISTPGTYKFAIDGDDAVDLTINGTSVVGWYGGHGANRTDAGLDSHSGTINLAAGTYPVVFRHQEGTGDDTWGLFWDDLASSAGRDDYLVRVTTCPANAALRESTCKTYPAGDSKPTGILHDYGESQRMYFGLITGSQPNNLQGGVLRQNISDFANEIDASNGVFKTGVNGIVRTIDSLRMIGGGYAGGTTNNLGSDSNWNWANGTGNCPSVGDRVINNGECRMWGNPIAEMMYEGLRYFAGAALATPNFAAGGASQGTTEETSMGLPQPGWKDPYKSTATGGLGYPTCAKPFQTVISDINPSYDGNLPNSFFGGAAANGTTPASISAFDPKVEGDAMWAQEFGAGPRSVFVGEVGGVSDGVPTAKSASTFANIRGLSPEEPTKEGTYYSASVARFARNTDINPAIAAQNMGTYSIALASPLPRIEVPMPGGGKITLMPFGKTVAGTFGGAARKPTNTIVDFYVQELNNFPGQTPNNGVNGGLAKAVFRINYEDVEQGNDHDMDAIVRYEVTAKADNTLDVQLTSEYAAGSAVQYMGYTLSGTTKDGVYLEVCDLKNGIPNGGTRASCDGQATYAFNTPPGRDPGYCAGGAPPADCLGLPPTSDIRNFSPSATASAIQLENPLWYAAKYGGDANWDANGDKVPDNYFLVTNPLELRAQLSKAFDAIANQDVQGGNLGVTGARVSGTSFTVQPTFNVSRNNNDWTGDLKAVALNADGSLGVAQWSAKANLPPAAGATSPAARKIWTSIVPGIDTAIDAVEFKAPGLGTTDAAVFTRLGLTTGQVANDFGPAASQPSAAQLVDYLRGVQAKEVPNAGGSLRTRTSVLGDIVNSEPVISSPRNDYGYANFDRAGFADMFDGYADYLTLKRTDGRKPAVYVGANDGMFHIFDGTNGKELFAYVPNGVLGTMGELALPDRPATAGGRTFSHRYYVDGQTTVVDAKKGGAWQTVAIGTTGAGGRSVFALNTTSTTSMGKPQVMWERTGTMDGDLGNTLGKVLVLPLANGQWGAVYGNGYGSANSDPVLYVVDVFTGQQIAKIRADDGAAVMGGRPLGTTDPWNGLGQITAIDTNADGKVDYIYGGDLQGNLWKFDLTDVNATAWKVAFSGKPLFKAITGTEPQPITGGIRVSRGPGLGYSVFFGTGRYLLTGDNVVAATPQIQSFYGVLDDNSRNDGRRANLTAQALTEFVDAGITVRTTTDNVVPYFGTAATRGWYMDLAVGGLGKGERFVGTPRIQNGKVIFASFNPTGSSCDPGGANLLYGLDLISGSGALTGVAQVSGGAVSTRGNTGAVQTAGGAPITSISVLATNEVKKICPAGGCTPSTPPGPTYEECEVVIYPGALVLPRACGRQSWRQLR